METIRPFQIGLLAVFAIIGLASLAILATYQGLGLTNTNPYGDSVIIWGTLDEKVFTSAIQEVANEDKDFLAVKYLEKDPRTFEKELINAIADGRGPDAIILNHEDFVTLRSKLQAISYDDFSERMLKDTYVDGFEIFARNNGLYAIPFMVDPLVMYWNRDLFAGGGLSQPPATWESLTDVVESLTLRDATRNIQQATVAFGEYQNVVNAKATLLTLMLQSGSQMIVEGQSRYEVKLDTSLSESTRQPLFSTLQFFVEFSNVSSPLYSWNRTFQDDQSAFLGERLALYFGYGSEAKKLSQQNPNLNFDATGVPQGSGATVKRAYGRFYGLAILSSSKNYVGTYRALAVLANPTNTAKIAGELSLSPAHRSTLSTSAPDAMSQTRFNQSLIARGWLDPGAEASQEIFGQMIDDVISGRSQIGTASSDTIRRLELAF